MTRRNAKAWIEAGMRARVDRDERLKKARKLSRFDHVAVTGIQKEGDKAKAEVLVTFRITPEGMRRVEETQAVLTEEKRILLGEGWHEEQWSGNDDTYVVKVLCDFVRNDDGWRLAHEYEQ